MECFRAAGSWITGAMTDRKENTESTMEKNGEMSYTTYSIKPAGMAVKMKYPDTEGEE